MQGSLIDCCGRLNCQSGTKFGESNELIVTFANILVYWISTVQNKVGAFRNLPHYM